MTAALGETGGLSMGALHDWENFMIASGAAPATVKIRLGTIRTLMGQAGVDDPLRLTRADVVRFLARPSARWTRTTYWQCVRGLELWLREFGYGDLGLLRGIGRPRPPAPHARPIDDATIAALLAYPLRPRPYAYVRLALFAMLRVHEVAQLRGEDLQSGWLMVTGKGGDTKVIPAHPEVAAIAATMPAKGFWFPSSVNAHVRATSVSTTIGEALRLVGSDATAHRLRDTGATRLQRQARDIRLVQEMLRHSDLQSTMKYTKVSNDALHEAVSALSWVA